nr:tyrosine-type recombinase/integrase [Devosia sp. WQ 349K1]
MNCLWRILAGTGCRLSEITGLRREDVVLDTLALDPLPHIRVAWHENRRLKTQSSIRCVPLVGDALDAANVALSLSEGTMLFPRYGRHRGGDAASQALMKHVRKVTTNPKHVIHSLRHNMKDRLALAQTPELVRNLIMGWSLDSVGDRVYGGEKAKLLETTRAMRKAFGQAD